MAPLAGKPPFATDEPDSFYESSPAPRPRVRMQPPPDPNKRSSAYDVYDNYLGDNHDKAASRQSGMGALGMGLMNMDDTDDEDEDEDSWSRKPQQTSQPATSASKHAALAAATAAANSHRNNSPPIPPPQPIAAPRPGYAAPIAALNLARPEPIAQPQGRQPQHPHPHALQVKPRMTNPFETPMSSPVSGNSPYHLPTSPTPTMTEPHPLLPPVTPITPVFARPVKVNAVKFSETAVPRDPSKPIMRGNSEETLLPNRGEKGDDFWRRFSMIAKEENRKPQAQKQSLWLKKTQNGSTRLSRWVWIVGIILILCIGGAIGIGWYVSHNSPDNQPPTAFGGSANETAAPAPTTKSNAGGASSSSLHVTPTHTVARRAPDARVTTGFNAVHKRRMH